MQRTEARTTRERSGLKEKDYLIFLRRRVGNDSPKVS